MTVQEKEEYFDKMHKWSERKLQLLQKYVDPATRILGSIRQVYYVDGFAGRGSYRDGSKGSPVRIAELAQQFEKEGKPYSFKCINVEENGEYFANLQEDTARFGRTIQNLHGKFVDHLDYILQVIGNQPAIFFLDPFGVKGIDWIALSKIINRSAPTDIWIRFDHVEVRRLDGNYEINEKKFDILPTVYGIQDEFYLHSRLSAGNTPEDRIQDCTELYRGQLEREFKRAKGTGYAGAYPIRTLTGQDKYYLVFATAHAKGIVLASNVIYGVEEKYQLELQEFREAQEREEREGHQLLLFAEPTAEEIFQDKVTRLKEDIWLHCKGKQLSRIDIHVHILRKWFGKIKAPHMTSALNALKNDGRILEIGGNTSQDKTLFKFRDSN